MIYKCWDPESGDETNAVEIEAYTPVYAAEGFARMKFREKPFESIDVAVNGHRYSVRLEMRPTFYARLRET